MNTTSLEVLSLPYSDCLNIYERAFSNSGIKELSIPYCIDTDLWFNEIFKDCPNLTNVYTEWESYFAPKALLYPSIFAGVAEKATLWVREGMVETFQALDGWKDFYQIKENLGIPTAIEHPSPNTHHPSPIYDLQGRRVENAQKGIYIMNGRKVVIK